MYTTPGAGVQVEVDALTHEAILAVEEDRLALGDGLAGGPIELDSIGHEAVVPPDDLHVARGQEKVGGAAHLLDAVGDDIGLAAGSGNGQGRLLRERRPDSKDAAQAGGNERGRG